MKSKKRDRLRIREVDVERLVVREPRGGRVRAILETGPPRPGMERPDLPSARLSLLDGHGAPRLVAEVDAEGHATLFIGGPDTSPMVVVTPTALDVWSKGSIVASIRADDGKGVVETRSNRREGRSPRRRGQ